MFVLLCLFFPWYFKYASLYRYYDDPIILRLRIPVYNEERNTYSIQFEHPINFQGLPQINLNSQREVTLNSHP